MHMDEQDFQAYINASNDLFEDSHEDEEVPEENSTAQDVIEISSNDSPRATLALSV